ncbi:MAG: hypothetical protein WBQ18_09270 [Solirubrobacteraceae bacterium]
MLRSRLWLIPLLLAAGLAVSGCGASSGSRAVGLKFIPLPPRTQITARVHSCDRGANAYCSEQIVVVGPAYSSSADLLITERHLLDHLGWSSAAGADGPEKGEDSPGHEVRLLYATAYGDLLGIDSSWIRRSPPIARALASAMFDRRPALSIMLVRGSS